MKIVLTHMRWSSWSAGASSVEWVEATVMQPQRRDPDPHDAALERLYRAIPQMGNRVLRVVVCWSSAEECRVVTAFPDRNAARDETEHKAR